MERNNLNLRKKNTWKQAIKMVSVLFILLILLLPIFRAIQDNYSKLRTIPDFTLRVKAAPIAIVGNTALNNTASSGNGTVNNPYIIEDKIINASAANSGINITNTNAYFIIRNCTITDSNVFAGILLENVTNGKLENNTLNNNFYVGIYLVESNNNSITQNIINSHVTDTSIFGIYLFNSDSNRIANNTVKFSVYGIYLWTSSNNNTIQNNTANNNGYGIYLEDYSNYNNITGNVFHNNYYEPYSETSGCIGNVFADNDCTWNKIIISKNADFKLHTQQGNGSVSNPYMLEDRVLNLTGKGFNGIVIQNTDAYFVIRNCTIFNGDYSNYGMRLLNITNGLIFNNTINANYEGINLQNSHSVNITENILYYNYHAGISVYYSNNTRIINNTILNADDGITINTANNNTVWYNKVISNSYYGFFLNAANGNTFINNTALYASQYGFHLNFACNNTFINNTCIYNGFSGFYLATLSCNNTLMNNILKYNYQYGIEVHSSDNNTISWNIINDNSIEGIRLYKANYNHITWNTLYRNPQAINELSCIGNIIENNDFGLLPAFLFPIFPNPNVNGFVYLNWSSVGSATRYYIYRSTSVIESVDELVPIALVSTNNYTDRVHVNGTFYYIIIAGHLLGNSSISNCENVTVLVTQSNDGVLFIIIGIIIIGAIVASSISIYSLRRRTILGAAPSVGAKFKNLSLTEKLQLVITKRISIEDFDQLNAPDLTNLLESEIGVISSEIKVRASSLPISNGEKDEILQELARLPPELQVKLLSQLEESVLDSKSGSD